MALRFTGIDPGLVHTAVVTLEVDPRVKRWGTDLRVFDGLGDVVVEEIKEYTLLVWDYKLVGRIYGFYSDDAIMYVEDGKTVVGVEQVVADTLAFTAAVPAAKRIACTS